MRVSSHPRSYCGLSLIAGVLASSLLSTQVTAQKPGATTGTLQVGIYLDKNSNGAKDTGESGKQGWTLKITGANTMLNVVTGPDGTGTRTLAPGSYTVTLVSLQPGWNGTSTNTKVVAVVAGGAQVADFGVVPPAAGGGGSTASGPGNIQLQVYNDLNGNGHMDGGENMIQGWTFKVSGPGLAQPRTLVIPTNSVGGVAMGLPSGPYTVVLTAKQGWTTTDALTRTVVVPPGNPTLFNFGMKATP